VSIFKYIASLFKKDPAKKILKERDELYKKSVILQRNGDLREYGKVMKRIEDLENEYDQLKNNKQKTTDTSCDAIDYDGMGNQGRFPTHK
jgi:hypothetical protein